MTTPLFKTNAAYWMIRRDVKAYFCAFLFILMIGSVVYSFASMPREFRSGIYPIILRTNDEVVDLTLKCADMDERVKDLELQVEISRLMVNQGTPNGIVVNK